VSTGLAFVKATLPLTPDLSPMRTTATHLVDAVQELQEDGRDAAALAAERLRPPVAEPVAEGEPLLLHQQPEAIERPVVRV